MCYAKPCRCSCEMKEIDTDHRYLCEYGPGSFCYKETVEGEHTYKIIIMKLPDYAVCVIPIEPTGTERINWEWDGVLKHPTLSPSVIHWGFDAGTKYEAWHGQIKKGMMESV